VLSIFTSCAVQRNNQNYHFATLQANKRNENDYDVVLIGLLIQRILS